MSNFDIELPSGLVIEAAPLYGREIIQIAERVGPQASGDTLCAFMTATCKRVLDPGPYTFVEAKDGSPNWRRMLWGDLLYAIIRLRVESFPEHRGNFDFEFSCPYCKGLSGGAIDLAELIADPDHFQALPETSRETLLANKLFEATTPSGVAVKFDLARVEQDEPMKVQMKRRNRTKETDVEVIAKRLRFVEGLKKTKTGEAATDLQSLWTWAQGLSANDIDALLDAMTKADIIVDSKILAWCRNVDTECGRQSRIPLPLDIAFFRPRSGTRKGATARDGDSPLSSPESRANGGSTSNQSSSGTKPTDPASP